MGGKAASTRHGATETEAIRAGLSALVGRVARIVLEFCARANPDDRATPCAGRNKEFLARGVFYLFNCCTNVVISCQSAGGIPTHDFANSAALRPSCFAHHDTALTLQRPAREHVHKGGSGA